MSEEQAAETLWSSDSRPARLARIALAPLAGAYAGVVAARNALYGLGVLASHDPALPAVSVGNLSVGGTGKTPVAAWLAGELRRRGASPAIVLRGYGGDEALVHAALNPDVPVIVDADRVRGSAEALRLGADVVVLDDAFQHRRARRLVDLVLISADRWTARRRPLPVGPWREPLTALARASVVLITRKAASLADAERVAAAVRAGAGEVPQAIAHLAPDSLRTLDGTSARPLDELRGATVLAIAAVGDPHAFVRQLRDAGLVPQAAIFPDHFPFGREDAERLARRAEAVGAAMCTLKDAVKLAPHWPRAAPPLWYVSQHVILERGGECIESHVATLLHASLSHRHRSRERGLTDSNGHRSSPTDP